MITYPFSTGHGRLPRLLSKMLFNLIAASVDNSTLTGFAGAGAVLTFLVVDFVSGPAILVLFFSASFLLRSSAAVFANASFLASSCALLIAVAIALLTFCICFFLAAICLFSSFPSAFNFDTTSFFSFCWSANTFTSLLWVSNTTSFFCLVVLSSPIRSFNNPCVRRMLSPCISR